MSKIINEKPLTEDQIQIVEILKQTLAQALTGEFHTLAVLVCMHDGFASVHGGRNAGALNLALDELKLKILTDVSSGTTERQTRQSSILRPKFQS